MAASRAEIRAQLRSALSDFPSGSASLTEAVSAAATTFKFAAADIARFKEGYDVEVEEEVCRVVEVTPSGNGDGTVIVLRGHMGSTAASHAAGKVVWCQNLFCDFGLNRLLNRAIASTWPAIWIEREAEHSAVTGESFEYELGATDVISVFIETAVGSGRYWPVRNCHVRSYVETQEDESLIRRSALTFNVQPPWGLKVRYGYLEAVGPLDAEDSKLEAEVLYPALVEYVISRAASYAAAELRGRRQRFHEYSVATGDRVADVDQIIRSEFAYRNAADVVMADMKRPYPPVWRTRLPR